MKKVLFLVALSLIAFSNVYSQSKSKDVKVKWGDEMKESKKSSLSDVIGYDASGFYTLSSKSSSIIIGQTTSIKLSHFSNDVNLLKETELEIKDNKKDMEFEFIVQMENKLYVFSSLADKKTNKNELFVQTINKKSLELNNDRKKIAEIPYETKLYRDRGNFGYTLSSDSSKINVFYNLPYEKNENEKFGFHVLDVQMNEIWSKNIELPYTDELFVIYSHILDNDGNVHILGKKYEDKLKSTRKGEVNYNYIIISYNKGESNSREYLVKLDGKYLNEMKIVINDDKEIICAGFYSNTGISGADGCFFLKIDSESKAIVLKNFKEFDLDFITQNMSDKEENKTRKKEAKGKDVELYKYDIDDLIMSDDGSIFLVGEQYYVIERTSTTTSNGNTSTKTSYHYYYKDIIVVHIDFQGNIVWAKKVGKAQHTINDNGYFSSYVLSIIGDKLYFIFNDHSENLVGNSKKKELKEFRSKKDAVIVIVQMDCEGNQTRKALFTAKEAEVLARPKVCEQISENELILFGQKGKTHRFAKVTFLQ